MKKIIKRYIDLLRSETYKSFWALSLFVTFNLSIFTNSYPIIQENCTFLLLLLLVVKIYEAFIVFVYEKITGDEKVRYKRKNSFKDEMKIIKKELLMFIPILILNYIFISLFTYGLPENEISVRSMLVENPVFYLFSIVIFGPIIEETIYRFLPYKFIKNKYLYIIISSVLFASAHVIDDPKFYYYFWFYIIHPLYYSYRYYKTTDILVTISMHSFNNLIAIIPILVYSLK